MSVRDFTLGQLDVVFHGWLAAEAAADFASNARLGTWRPAVEEMSAKVRSTSGGTAPDLADPVPTGPGPMELDRLVEASVRALGWAMSAVEQAARSAGDVIRGDRLATAFGFVFDRGMRFLALPLPEQVGETRRLVNLARHETVGTLMANTQIAGADWATLVARVEAANLTLEAALAREAAVIEKGPSAKGVRVEGLRLANLVAQTAETVLPKDVADRFLAVFRREVARAGARKAGQGLGVDVDPGTDDGGGNVGGDSGPLDVV